MNSFLALFASTVPVLMVLDLAWIGGIAKNYYKTQLGALLAQNVTWWAAGLLYVLYGSALVFFVIQPALAAHSLRYALLAGFFFGIAAFSVYDLTNLATTANWPIAMSFVDMLYGGVAAALTSGAVYLLATRVFA